MNAETEFERVVEEYRDEGYIVVPHPGADLLPPFALDFGVDILAERGDERVLVQVKRDRADLQADPNASRRAEVTNAQPGWRYDLVVLREDNPVRRIARMAGEPSVEQIQQMLAEAELATKAGSPRAGFLVAWGGLEATMRRTARRAGVGGAADTLPPTLIRELYSSGVISSDDFHKLEEARRQRNELVHGFVPPAIEGAAVQSLIDYTKRLLAESDTLEPIAP